MTRCSRSATSGVGSNAANLEALGHQADFHKGRARSDLPAGCYDVIDELEGTSAHGMEVTNTYLP